MTKFLIVTYLATVALSGAIFGVGLERAGTADDIGPLVSVSLIPVFNVAGAAFLFGAMIEDGSQ